MLSLISPSFYNLYIIIILYFLTDKAKSKRLDDSRGHKALKWKSVNLKMGCLNTHYIFFEFFPPCSFARLIIELSKPDLRKLGLTLETDTVPVFI